jgi:hypothetical protein
VVLALAGLRVCRLPSADPAETDSQLLMLLAESARWLAAHHDRLAAHPGAAVASAATLPADAALRSRALEYATRAAGEPCGGTASKLVARSRPPAHGQHLLLLSASERWGCCVRTLRTNADAQPAGEGADAEADAEQDKEGCGRVSGLAMHPGGRMLATAHGVRGGRHVRP